MTDEELTKFGMAFRRGILGRRSKSHRACFMVAAPLVSLLGLHGVEAELIEGDTENINHFWLRLADGRVLDPTADQFEFGLPAIYLGPPDARIHRPLVAPRSPT